MVAQSELQTDWAFVADDDAVAAAAATLAAGHGPVGVDAERASGYRYGGDAYLVQMYRRDAGTFLFDPTKISSFAPLATALAGEEWIFHAATQDIPCLDEIGLRPPRLFDTELAARLLGFERVGLGSVTEQLLDITLEKAYSAADWSTRPLPEAWLEYAALDVVLLPDLRDLVQLELERQGKTEIAAQEFQAVLEQQPKPALPEPWRKLSGTQSLRTPRALALARELWLAREALARERDIAPGRLIPDRSIIAAAAANPRSPEDLSRLSTFKGRESRSELMRWWKAILRAKTTTDLPGPKPRDPGGIPHHRNWALRHPDAADRLTVARAAIEAEAEQQGMPTENLLKPSLLRTLAWEAPYDGSTETVERRLRELGAREWQVGITAPILAASFVAPL
ncbi:ribonuclease D [Leucobacter exalbidus]|uniref:Ribonuclease D n=1 Tax=Leucobacter exalbidus TaxID=662960 RepID=A0A940T306_9MICO|nr:HRDC domain-containing protein [Leucobacter exalbidus]MBP1325338.1 ribonuclease D [Leucobacter exalbidus]